MFGPPQPPSTKMWESSIKTWSMQWQYVTVTKKWTVVTTKCVDLGRTDGKRVMATLARVVVSVSTSRSRGVSKFRLEKNCQRLGLVSVSGGRHLGLVSVIYVSCQRPIFRQTVQTTLIKWVNFGRHGNASLSQPQQLVRSAFIHVEW